MTALSRRGGLICTLASSTPQGRVQHSVSVMNADRRDARDDARVRVLADDALLRHVSSFQSGVPLLLYQFWLAHNPPPPQPTTAGPKRAPEPRAPTDASLTQEPVRKAVAPPTSSFRFGSTSPPPSEKLRSLFAPAMQARTSFGFGSLPLSLHPLPAQSSTPLFTEPVPAPVTSPPPSKSLRGGQALRDLVSLVIKHGTLELFKLTQQIRVWHESATVMRTSVPPHSVTISSSSGWVPVDLGHDDVVQKIIENNRADMLEWGISTGLLQSTPCRLWLLAIKHCREGDVRVLNVLLASTQCPFTELQHLFRVPSTVDSIADPQLFEWLRENAPGVVTANDMVAAAVNRGDLESVRDLCETFGDQVNDRQLFGRACRRAHLTIMAFLLQHRSDLVDLVDVKRVLQCGDPSSVRVVNDSMQFVGCVEALLAQEAESLFNDVTLLSHMCINDQIPPEARVSIDAAAASGRFDLVWSLHAKGVAVATTEAMDRAAENNHWDIVQFLHTNSTEGCTTRVMDAAAAHGRFDYFKYLHRHRSEGFSSRALELAAATGKIEFVRYILGLSDHGGCTTRAMAAAAQRGHLEIVKLLHEKRSEMCSWTMAVTGGACQVHGAVREDDLNGASNREHPFKQVIENDHVDVVNFLYEHYPARFTPALLHSLLLHGVFDVWMQLHELYPDEANAVVGPVLHEAGRHMRMKTIRFIVNELWREDLAFRAIDGAATGFYDDLWLRAVFTVTGPHSFRQPTMTAALSHLSDRVSAANFMFLFSQCSDDSAKDHGIRLAEASGRVRLAGKLKRWNKAEYLTSLPTLHPFLLDPRASHWANILVTRGEDSCVDPYERCSTPFTWPVRAVLHNDLSMLQLIHDSVLDSSSSPLRPNGPTSADPAYSFDGAQAAAVRAGNLPILQWLIETVDLPIDPTLLLEAFEFQRYEVATWLAHNVPDMRWEWCLKEKDPWSNVDEAFLEWVEASSDAVRDAHHLTNLAQRLREAGGEVVDTLRRPEERFVSFSHASNRQAACGLSSIQN